MDLRRIRTFVAVADQGTVSRAALHLGTAQPVLSRHIGELERELGLKLFDRVGRRLFLTVEGEELLVKCRGLLSQVSSIADRAQLLRRGSTGVLKVAAPSIILETVFAPFLHRYAKRRPDVQVKLMEAVGIDMPAMLERGDIHLGISLLRTVHADHGHIGTRPLPSWNFWPRAIRLFGLTGAARSRPAVSRHFRCFCWIPVSRRERCSMRPAVWRGVSRALCSKVIPRTLSSPLPKRAMGSRSFRQACKLTATRCGSFASCTRASLCRSPWPSCGTTGVRCQALRRTFARNSLPMRRIFTRSREARERLAGRRDPRARRAKNADVRSGVTPGHRGTEAQLSPPEPRQHMTSISHELFTPLRRDDCVARLKAATGRSWSESGKEPFVASIRRDSIVLKKRLAPFRRETFQPCLYGRMMDRDGGTLIQCRFGVHPLVRRVMLLWLSLAFTGATAALVSVVPPLWGKIACAILGGTASIAMWCALFRRGGYVIPSGETLELRDFLCMVVEAHPRNVDTSRPRDGKTASAPA